MIYVLLVFVLGSLSEEADSFMNEYMFNGYSSLWSRGVYLHEGEPVSFLIYPCPNLGGVLCGLGGKAIYDLRLELQGDGMNIIDEQPDDLPVLQFATGSDPVAYTVTVTAAEMLYGERADSAYIFFAMRPVLKDTEKSVPVETDSEITGE
jgi:hypothetical protein